MRRKLALVLLLVMIALGAFYLWNRRKIDSVADLASRLLTHKTTPNDILAAAFRGNPAAPAASPTPGATPVIPAREITENLSPACRELWQDAHRFNIVEAMGKSRELRQAGADAGQILDTLLERLPDPTRCHDSLPGLAEIQAQYSTHCAPALAGKGSHNMTEQEVLHARACFIMSARMRLFLSNAVLEREGDLSRVGDPTLLTDGIFFNLGMLDEKTSGVNTYPLSKDKAARVTALAERLIEVAETTEQSDLASAMWLIGKASSLKLLNPNPAPAQHDDSMRLFEELEEIRKKANRAP